MRSGHRFHVASLLLLVSAPPLWLACGGGEQKPAESAADESSNSSSESSSAAGAESAAPADTASAAPAEKAEKAEKADTTASAAPAEAAPPPAPTFGSTDCGACVDKTCAKQEAACAKNSDCQSMLDSMHGCSSAAASCVSGATMPDAAKPKKLAAAVEACAKKALTAKACKAKCQ